MSRHVKRLSLLMGAVFVLAALVATSASAAPLEYRSCVKAAKSGKLYTGKYLDKECTKAASKAQIEEGKLNKYESQLAPEEDPYTGKGKAATITAAGKTVICKKTLSAGELTTERFTTATLTFEKCAIGKTPCKSPSAGSGVIKSNVLHTGLVWLDGAETKLGVLIAGTLGGSLFEIECGGPLVQVKGRIVGSDANNKKGTAFTFATAGGNQALQEFFVEEEEFGPFALYTENEAEEQVEATLSVTTEQGPKGVYAI